MASTSKNAAVYCKRWKNYSKNNYKADMICSAITILLFLVNNTRAKVSSLCIRMFKL